jgi:AraC family transcriptional regulator
MKKIIVALALATILTAGGAGAADKAQVKGAKDPKKQTIDVKVRSVPKMRLACIRHFGPYEKSGPTWLKLNAWAKEKGIIRTDTVFLGLFYDDPDTTPASNLRCDACVTVGDDVTASGDFGIKEAGGKEYAVATHVGPYKNLKKTYRRIWAEGLPKIKRAYSSGPTMEIYRSDPKVTAPKDLITEIYVPLKP